MAQYTTEAIVLSVKNWGEADKMLQFFSRARGRVKAAAFGCRRPKSPLAGGMQLFNHLDLTLQEGDRIDTVRQCTLLGRFRQLSEDLAAMAYGSFVAELALELAPEGQPQPESFDRLLLIFAAFERHNPRLVALAAGYQLLELAGFQLHYEHCAHCGQPIEGDAWFDAAEGGAYCKRCRPTAAEPYAASLREFIVQLVKLDWAQPPQFSAKKAALLAAESLLLTYLRSLFGHDLKSLRFIRQLG